MIIYSQNNIYWKHKKQQTSTFLNGNLHILRITAREYNNLIQLRCLTNFNCVSHVKCVHQISFDNHINLLVILIVLAP